MFPGAHARVYRNEAGEPIGWDYPSDPDPNDYADDYDQDRGPYYVCGVLGCDEEATEGPPWRCEDHYDVPDAGGAA